MVKNECVELPDDLFDPPDIRPDTWPDDPELRRAVDWLKSFMSEEEWKQRRLAVARRLYNAAIGQLDDNKGRFFRESDTFGWYLFQAEAALDHIGNYEPMFGSRIVPLMITLGKNLSGLLQIDGCHDRASRIVKQDRAHPNSGMFELLVAAAYKRAGFHVQFVDELPGQRKTHDMLVSRGGRRWAVECKRMEVGEYGERERQKMRELWCPLGKSLTEIGQSTLAEVKFHKTLDQVPYEYLQARMIHFVQSKFSPLEWSDETATASVRKLDLTPLKAVLKNNLVLGSGTHLLQLLSGKYVRNANYISSIHARPSSNPRWIKKCDLAVLMHWESASAAAIEAKARDITKRLSEATEQLLPEMPSIVHIGFEAVEGDEVEKRRFEKILEITRKFDPRDKNLQYVYCHYFVPESPPDEQWAFDETVQCCPIRPTAPPPLQSGFLTGDGEAVRIGPHWQT